MAVCDVAERLDKLNGGMPMPLNKNLCELLFVLNKIDEIWCEKGQGRARDCSRVTRSYCTIKVTFIDCVIPCALPLTPTV